jgi:hypothetical protein
MVPHLWRPGVSWHFFDLGGRLLFSSGAAGGGLHLYASHPVLQIGPLSLLVAAPLRLADPWHGRIAAILLMTALGPVLLWLIGELRVVGAHAISRRRLTLAGLVFLPIWTEVAAHFAHLDDVLALTFAVLALHAVARQRALLTGLLLGCAVDSKPWAAAFIPLVFVLAPRQRLRAVAAWLGSIAIAWVPFLVGDPNSMRVASFTIPNGASSALRALGIYDPRTPAWDRPIQLILGCLLAWALVRTGRWPAALFAVIAVRLLFDPGTYAYYTSGLVLAAILVDLLLTKRRIPLYALTAAVVVYAARAMPLDAHTLGLLRASYCVAALTTLFLPQLRRLAVTAAPVVVLARADADMVDTETIALERAG